MDGYIAPWLEWEVLREPITIPNVDDAEELPEGNKKIVITRDEHHNLQAVLSMKGDCEFFRKETKNTVPGSFIELFEISGSDQYESERYTLESCHIASIHRYVEDEEEPLCESNLGVQGLKVEHQTETEGAALTEWYLNGPSNFIAFRNRTERKILSKLFRERSVLGGRSAPGGEKIQSIEISGRVAESSSFDFLRIQADEIQFLVTLVPKGLGPDWSSNVGIEYRKEWGNIPNPGDRKKISELCSFILGRQLLSVGYTIYDEDCMLVEEYACNPWRSHPESLCSKPDKAPIKIDRASSRGKAEDLIGQLLPHYFELREPLHLKDALWLYWIGQEMTVGTSLPLFAAAVEAIMNGWFNSKHTKSGGVYLDKATLDELFQDEMSSIGEKLEGLEYGDELMKRFKNSNLMGVMDRFRFFFTEIDLPVDKNEWDAIKARNAVAHGRIPTEEDEWEQIIRYTDTYETLIHKIILKLLGYSGSYIDRSVVGWKDKQLV